MEYIASEDLAEGSEKLREGFDPKSVYRKGLENTEKKTKTQESNYIARFEGEWRAIIL